MQKEMQLVVLDIANLMYFFGDNFFKHSNYA